MNCKNSSNGKKNQVKNNWKGKYYLSLPNIKHMLLLLLPRQDYNCAELQIVKVCRNWIGDTQIEWGLENVYKRLFHIEWFLILWRIFRAYSCFHCFDFSFVCLFSTNHYNLVKNLNKKSVLPLGVAGRICFVLPSRFFFAQKGLS